METNTLSYLHDRIRRVRPDIPEMFIAVDTAAQRLHLIRGDAVVRSFTISTAKAGIGNREGSEQTPPGVHAITEKIGAGAPAWRIFSSREDTGIDWKPGMSGENCILSRILRLQGLEEGINRGAGIDSYERYIYIHGTNREPDIGTPLSHGCVCMKNNDIIELFDLIREGTLVVID